MNIRKSGGPRDDLFERLYRKHYSRTYRFFRQRGLTDDEAHELAQETFTTIYKNFDAYRGEAEWKYIEMVARRILLNWIRANRTRKRGAETVSIDDEENPVDVAAPETPDVADKQLAERRTKALRDGIAKLPEGQRQCIQLALSDLTYEEIAKSMKISVDAVKSRLRDAKRTLRKLLGDLIPEDDQ